MLLCVKRIREHAEATGDTRDAEAVLSRVADGLDYHDRHYHDRAEGTKLAHGHRVSQASRNYAEALLCRYGGSAVAFATDNGGSGVSLSTARRGLSKVAPFVVGRPAPPENFESARVAYDQIRAELVRSGEMDPVDVVVVELSEDETPVPAEPSMVRVPMRAARIEKGEGVAGDTELAVVGICGKRGADHKCQLGYCRHLHPTPLETIIVVVVTEVAGGHLSTVMLNPLDPRFPARAVIMDSCCNRFDSVPHTEARWNAARAAF